MKSLEPDRRGTTGEPQTIEAWCERLVTTRLVAEKLHPPPAPTQFEVEPRDRSPLAPGRPESWRVVERAERPPRSLTEPAARARLLHTLAHHELQAAELFAYGVLTFQETPREFRSGLLRLCEDELRHLSLLTGRIEALGARFGEHPVRDWFWNRVPTCQSPESFVALMGLGLEGANLEHSARLGAALRQAGDEDSARVLDQIEREEIAHVAFARRWFEHFTGEALEYERWKAALPPPLTPAILKGEPIAREARRRAGQSSAFIDALEAEPRVGGPKR